MTIGTSAETAADYEYQYDIMGNISKIGAENLLISYNYLNLPKQVTKTGTPRSNDAATYVVGGTGPTASYIYLADGTKVLATGETGQGYEYLGSYSCTFSRLGIARASTALPSAYRKRSLRLSVNGSSVDIESIPFAGGRIVKTTNGYEPQYYITGANLFYISGTPSDGMVAMIAGDVAKGLGQQWIEAIGSIEYWLYWFNTLCTAESTFYKRLETKAAQKYPKKAKRQEWHHITPKYTGGDPKGEMVYLPSPYHQMITNEFRALYPYRQGPATEVVRKQIEKQVYRKYPIGKYPRKNNK